MRGHRGVPRRGAMLGDPPPDAVLWEVAGRVAKPALAALARIAACLKMHLLAGRNLGVLSHTAVQLAALRRACLARVVRGARALGFRAGPPA